MKSETVMAVGGPSRVEPLPPFDAAVGVLAAGVAHDFNNAITALRAVLYLAGVEVGPLASLTQCQSIVDRCSDLTRWLFSVTSGVTSFGKEGPAAVDLNTCVGDAAALVRGTLPRDVRLELELANEPAMIRLVPGLIAYVLIQLVQNASDALPDGGTISARVVGRVGEHLGVIVEDAGFGMGPETLSRAFEPFFTTKAASAGLGLANVRRIVHVLGGTVTLTSAPGQGTRATVSLPAMALAAAPPATTPG